MKKQIRLSASTIKTYMNCSFLFYQNYIKNIPCALHPSLPKGTLIHLVLELLLIKAKRKEIAKLIISKESLYACPSIAKLVHKNLKKNNLDDPLVFKEVESCILVGLKKEYFGEGNAGDPLIKIYSEQQFSIPMGDYIITGTIDKIAIFKDKLIIYDYKSSKQKFSGEDKEANIQAMLYLWAVRQLFPGKKEYAFKFVFLRFSKNPIQEHCYSEAQVDGFSEWAAYIIKLMANMDEHHAYSNFAADDKTKSWLCKAGATWKCGYYDPFDYYELVDSEGNVISSTIELPINILSNQRIIKKRYDGCARWIKARQEENTESFFDN